jgi:calcineurin-like phosphoesterase family protein
MIYLTSDTRYNHTNIITYCNRPFSSVGEMNQVLIGNINDIVKSEDTLYHLGDVAFGTDKWIEFINSLYCKNIHLVFGNHDYRFKSKMKHSGLFKSIDKQVLFIYKSKDFIFTHHPPTEKIENVWNCFGHIHSNGNINRKYHVDVGVDANNFKPISIDEIIEKYQ